MIFAFTLSHGQAQIERGFNNFDLFVENMLIHFIILQLRVYDRLNFSGSSPHNFRIENDLVISCIRAHPKHREHNSEKKTADKSKEHGKVEVLERNARLKSIMTRKF